MTDPETRLTWWTTVANRGALVLLRETATCIPTSLALAEFLRGRGLDAEVFRATATVFCAEPGHDRCHGSSAGHPGDGSRRPATGPGMWGGHLAVSCGEYILDPTIDQLATVDRHAIPPGCPSRNSATGGPRV